MAKQVCDIIEDLSDMSDEEVLSKIQQLRRTRNERIVVSSRAKDRPGKKEKKQDTVVSLLGDMSPEEREKLLSNLQKKG